MTDQTNLDPYMFPLSVESPEIYAAMKATPSDGNINRWRFFGEQHEFMNGEERLCEAVLMQACEDYTKRLVKQADYEDAKEWIFSEGRDGFTFNYVCESLRLNPNYVRKLLKAHDPGSRVYKKVIKTSVTLSRLKPESRAHIVELLKTDMIQRDIADRVGVAFETIRKVGIEEMGEISWRKRAVRILSLVQKQRQQRALEARRNG